MWLPTQDVFRKTSGDPGRRYAITGIPLDPHQGSLGGRRLPGVVKLYSLFQLFARKSIAGRVQELKVDVSALFSGTHAPGQAFKYVQLTTTFVAWCGRPPSQRFRSGGISTRISLVGVVWPTSLQRLSFGDGFNQPIVGVMLSIQRLTVGDKFDHPISGVERPASLQQLCSTRTSKPVYRRSCMAGLHAKRDL